MSVLWGDLFAIVPELTEKLWIPIAGNLKARRGRQAGLCHAAMAACRAPVRSEAASSCAAGAEEARAAAA